MLNDPIQLVPPEIRAVIFEDLAGDFGAISSCSLVQRSWLHETREHVFARTMINQFPCGNNPRDNATAFLELCRSPHSTILGAIKAVILHIEDRDLLEKVLTALAQAPHLSKINLFDRGMDECSVAAFQELSNCVRLEELVYNPFANFGEGEVQLISHFRELRSLSIYLTVCVKELALPTLPTESFRNLQTLRICAYSSEQMLQWFRHSQLDIALRTFDLRILGPPSTGWGSVAVLNSFLERQQAIADLSISAEYMYKDNRAGSVDEIINLEPLSNLQSLTLASHDGHSISRSLATLSSSASLCKLRIALLGWRGVFGPCPCDHYEEDIVTLSRATEPEGPLEKTFMPLMASRHVLWRYCPGKFANRVKRGTIRTLWGDEGWYQPDSRVTLYCHRTLYKNETREHVYWTSNR